MGYVIAGRYRGRKTHFILAESAENLTGCKTACGFTVRFPQLWRIMPDAVVNVKRHYFE
jgi:hypothetical protein